MRTVAFLRALFTLCFQLCPVWTGLLRSEKGDFHPPWSALGTHLTEIEETRRQLDSVGRRGWAATLQGLHTLAWQLPTAKSRTTAQEAVLVTRRLPGNLE